MHKKLRLVLALCIGNGAMLIAGDAHQQDSEKAALVARATPFLNAARDGDIETMKVILDSGGDVNVTGKNGFTALMVASYTEKLGSIDLLLERRARVNQTNDAGSTAINLVLTNKANAPFKQDILYRLLKANRYLHPAPSIRPEKNPEEVLLELQSRTTDDARKKVVFLEQSMEVLQDERRCTVTAIVLAESGIFPKHCVIGDTILSFVSKRREAPQEQESTKNCYKD